MEIIKKHNPNLVVSIHMNSFKDSSISGANCFYKIDDGASMNCANLIQRDDDKEDAVKQRLDIYYKNAEVVLNYYAKNNKLRVEKAGDKIGRTSKDVIADLVNDLK